MLVINCFIFGEMSGRIRKKRKSLLQKPSVRKHITSKDKVLCAIGKNHYLSYTQMENNDLTE